MNNDLLHESSVQCTSVTFFLAILNVSLVIETFDNKRYVLLYKNCIYFSFGQSFLSTAIPDKDTSIISTFQMVRTCQRFYSIIISSDIILLSRCIKGTASATNQLYHHFIYIPVVSFKFLMSCKNQNEF